MFVCVLEMCVCNRVVGWACGKKQDCRVGLWEKKEGKKNYIFLNEWVGRGEKNRHQGGLGDLFYSILLYSIPFFFFGHQGMAQGLNFLKKKDGLFITLSFLLFSLTVLIRDSSCLWLLFSRYPNLLSLEYRISHKAASFLLRIIFHHKFLYHINL